MGPYLPALRVTHRVLILRKDAQRAAEIPTYLEESITAPKSLCLNSQRRFSGTQRMSGASVVRLRDSVLQFSETPELCHLLMST